MSNEIGATIIIAIVLAPFVLPHVLPATIGLAYALLALGVTQIAAGAFLTLGLAETGRIWMFAVAFVALGLWTAWRGARLRRLLRQST